MADEDDLNDMLLAVAGRSKKRSRAQDDSGSEDLFGSSDSEDDASMGKGGASKKRREGSSRKEQNGDDDAGGRGKGRRTELDEEMRLFEEDEKRMRERQRNDVLQQARVKDAEEVEVRASSRRQPRGSHAQSSALQRLTEARERKAAGAREREREQEKRSAHRSDAWESGSDGGGGSDDSFRGDEEEDDDDAEAEEEPEEDDDAGGENDTYYRGEKAQRRSEYKDLDEDDALVDVEQEDASYEEVLSMQVRRAQLERWVSEPFFARALPHAVVRLGAGTSDSDERHYVMAQIVELKEGAPYRFGPSGLRTTKWLVVDDGDGQRPAQMALVSNADVTEEEFELWSKALGERRFTIMRKGVTDVTARLHSAENYKYTADDVQKILEEKRARGLIPSNLVQEKARLMRLRDQAASAKDKEEELERLSAQLAEVQAKMRRRDTRNAESAKVDLGAVNARNRKFNLEMAFKNVGNRPNNEKVREGVDVFSRRATRPNIYWNTRGAVPRGDDEHASQPSQDSAAAPHAGTSDTLVASEKLKASLQRMDPAQLIKCLDLDIDTSLLSAFSFAAPLPKRLLGARWHLSLSPANRMDLSGKTLLSVADWKRRAGIE